MLHNIQNYQKTFINLSGLEVIGSKTSVQIKELLEVLNGEHERFKNARANLESLWFDYYVSYFTNPAAARVSVTSASKHIGNVQTSWHHKTKSPGAYTTVETLVSYFVGAFFPNDYWFNLVPEAPIEDPNFNAIIELNRKYLDTKFSKANFRTATEIALRECAIAGTSAVMFPWKDGNASFKALSPFEFYLDPDVADPNEANLIRPYSLHLAEALEYADSGLFNLASSSFIKQCAESPEPNIDMNMYKRVSEMLGVDETSYKNKSKKLTVYEFWGDLCCKDYVIKNVRITWTSNGLLLNLDTNPYVKRPFMVLNYLRLGKSPYGLGALAPVASQLYYRDVVTNRHADSVALSDPVILYRQDAIVDPDDIVVRPGQKIPVTDINGISALTLGGPTNASVQDMALIDSMVDRAVGTGPYIGVDRGRSGDRVTAEEVAAQREAGGKRLSTIYSALNRDFLVPIVERFHYYCRMFEEARTVVNYGDTYIGINPEAIQYPFTVKAMGANNIASREYDIRQLLDWMNVVGQNEQLAARVNWEEVLVHLTSLMVPSLAQTLLMQAQPQAQPMTPDQAMQQQIQEQAMLEGGAPNERRVQAAQLAGSLEQELSQRLQQATGESNNV